MLDLARELNQNGFDVKFYSYVPRKRAKKFGMDPKCVVSFFWVLFPFLALEHYTKHAKWAVNLRRWALDSLCLLFMRRCDIIISMSGEFNRSNRKVKRLGGYVIIERGSKHILEQKRILESIPSQKGKIVINQSNIDREVSDYNIADYISIAAQHVKDSFIKYGFPEEKLYVNPYGVELSMFKPLPAINKEYDVIMTGTWSFQKGCDLITSAFVNTDVKVLHVGGIGDCEFPIASNFVHVDKVDQSDLVYFYNLAKVFVMPSRQDGFGMVYSQAMACNLPIVGSIDSGAPDLKRMINDSSNIVIIKEYTPESVKLAVEEALRRYNSQNDEYYAGNAIGELSWKAYGKRYADFLNHIISMYSTNGN